MSRVEGAVARLRSLVRGRAAETRADEEFEFHIAKQTEKNLAAGMTPAEARRRALLAFGAADAHREAMRDERRPRLLAELTQDVRFAARSLRHSRAFALTAVVVIALGVGATTGLFSLANTLLFRPLPVAAPGELYMLQEVRRGAVSIGTEGRRVPYARYEAYAEATSGVFDGLAAHVFRSLSLRGDAGATAISGALTSPNYFQVLGQRPALGQLYTRGAEPVAVVSHRFWREHFEADAAAIGRAVHLDGRPYTVIGVAPRGFDGTTTGLTVAIWLPFDAVRLATPSDMDYWVGMFGRVRERGAIERANAALSTLALRIPPDEPQTTVERAYLAPLTGLPEGARAQVGGFLGMLLAAGFLVLMIAAANIAALLLARSVARRREIALRLALGAGRLRLIRQLLTESTVLFLAGGAGGIVLAYVATGMLSRLSIPGVPIALDATPDVRVLGFALAVAALTGVVFGLAPALSAVRPDLVGALKDGTSSGASARTRGRSTFVAAQLAFTMLLLITAGLFVRGLQRGLAVHPGFSPDRVVIGSIDLDRHGLTEEEGRAFQTDLLRRVQALPAVESAAFARMVMLTGNQSASDVRSADGDSLAITAAHNVVDADYFRTLRIPLVAGRGFTTADARGTPHVVVVNETLAERLWPARNPLGQHLVRGGTTFQVIGVARDGRYVDIGEAPRAFAFYAASQDYSPRMTLHVRGRGDPARLTDAVRRELHALDPDVALEFAMPLATMMAFPLMPYRFAAALIGAFGLLGLILAAAGVYGVMAYHVAQRTREFGIRLALGAPPAHLLRLVIGRSALIAGGGAAAGVLLAILVTRLVAGMLFGLSPLDPVTFGSVALTLAAVALLATWLPARRALDVDPSRSLRAE
jgi:predicted permease